MRGQQLKHGPRGGPVCSLYDALHANAGDIGAENEGTDDGARMALRLSYSYTPHSNKIIAPYYSLHPRPLVVNVLDARPGLRKKGRQRRDTTRSIRHLCKCNRGVAVKWVGEDCAQRLFCLSHHLAWQARLNRNNSNDA